MSLEILAFPCNQFLKEEPGSSQEAEELSCTGYKAEYPIFGKVRLSYTTCNCRCCGSSLIIATPEAVSFLQADANRV
ncbi:putative glutathione peroxidase 4 [Glycine soja]